MRELRLDVLTEPLRRGERVADVCRRFGTSRDLLPASARRYPAEGLDGLEDRSRLTREVVEAPAVSTVHQALTQRIWWPISRPEASRSVARPPVA